MSNPPAQFLSCDWGTTSFRLRLVETETGLVLAEIKEKSGVKALLAACKTGSVTEREAVFSKFLLEKIPLLGGTRQDRPIPILISGMASSSVGWREVPYAEAPFPLDGTKARLERIELVNPAGTRYDLSLIGGVRTSNEAMRGEETEVLGLMGRPEYRNYAMECCIVLPGSHSKHVEIANHAIRNWRTFMTGELFDVLASQSLLRASVSDSEGFDLRHNDCRNAFVAGVREVANHGLAASLFQTRTRTVLQKIPPTVNRWFLSGLLIGAEVSHLLGETGGTILLAAPAATSEAYSLAFQKLQREVLIIPPDELSSASVFGHRVLMQRSIA